MEPNKLDQEIKQKFENRTIQPSLQAWDRLDAMLDAVEKTKIKPNYNWIYIAAGFIGFLLIGTVFFNDLETENTNNFPVVVHQKPEIEPLEKEKLSKEVITPSVIVKKRSTINEAVVTITNTKKGGKQFNTKVQDVLILKASKENQAIVSSSENKNFQPASKNKYISAEQLLAEVTNTKYEAKETDRTLEKTSKGFLVNPNSLLSNAETELNQTFREAALERLNKKFNTIKTVLVNRNYKE